MQTQEELNALRYSFDVWKKYRRASAVLVSQASKKLSFRDALTAQFYRVASLVLETPEQIELRKKREALEAKIQKELAEKNKALKDRAATATDAIQLSSVLGAVLNVMSVMPSPLAQGIANSVLASSVSGLDWNTVDSIWAGLTAREVRSRLNLCAHNEAAKRRWVTTNLFWAMVATPVGTLWGFVSMLMMAHQSGGIRALFLVSGATLGASLALSASSFAFAGGSFLMAARSGYSWYRATQKLNEGALLEDREEKLSALTIKIKSCDDEKLKTLLTLKQNRIQQQVDALSATEPTKIQKKLITLLQLKQKNKIEKQRLDAMANLLCGLGAVCLGIAFLFPPAAIILNICAAILYSVSAVMRLKQFHQKISEQKIRTTIFKSFGSCITPDVVEQKLICEYFSIDKKDKKEYAAILSQLSVEDRKVIVDIKCMEKYKSLPKTEAERRSVSAMNSAHSFYGNRKNLQEADPAAGKLPATPPPMDPAFGEIHVEEIEADGSNSGSGGETPQVFRH